jgi:hypothetical protein
VFEIPCKLNKLSKKIFSLFSIFFLCSFVTSSLQSEEVKSIPQKGLFIGFTVPGIFFTGDFNGDLVLANQRETFFVPDLISSFGYGFSFGLRQDKGLWDFTYYKLHHKSDSDANEENSLLYLLSIDAKPYLFAKESLQSYLLLGICVPWIRVDKGSKKGKVYHEAKYYGIGINIGTGVNLYIFPELFISGQFIYRFMGMLYVKGSHRRRDVTDLYVGDINGLKQDKFLSLRGLSFGISVGFCF